MRSRREEEPGRFSLKGIQDRKIGLIRAGAGRFALRVNEAAVALGIPADDLETVLLGEGKAFVVAPSADRTCLVFSVEETWQGRDIWQEVLGSLGKGRSETGLRKTRYLGLFYVCKAIWEGHGIGLRRMTVGENAPQELKEIVQFAQAGGKAEVMEDVGLLDLRAMASVVFLTLPQGTREEIRGDGHSPEFILRQRL